MARIIDGEKLAEKKEKELAKKVAEFKAAVGFPPKLVAVMIGDDPASKLYLKVKEKAARRVGILFEKKEFSATRRRKEIGEFIKALNINSSVHGIMVQLPLPKKLSILGAIAPSKDVDCLTPENLGLLMMGRPYFLPATVKAVDMVLEEAVRDTFLAHGRSDLRDSANGGEGHKFDRKDSLTASLAGRCIVVVGAGNLVGKPLAIHLKNLRATVTICDEYTRNLEEFTREAEILILATGVPSLIKKEMVKKGAVVIDIGSPEGDVDFDQVKKVASVITPVPGGVGPLTVSCLLENAWEAAKESWDRNLRE